MEMNPLQRINAKQRARKLLKFVPVLASLAVFVSLIVVATIWR
jgi:hypothetical protein